jgi:LmbE family N-acetylglucosaminyl deacetylase
MSSFFRPTRSRALSRCLSKFQSRRRRFAALCGSALAVAMLPTTVFQFVLYRQNLAMARETYPLTAPVQKHDRLLIISPHCDDETLGAGGTIAAARRSGAATRVVFLTNGDGSRSTQVYTEAREFEADLESWARPSTWSTLLAARGGSQNAARPKSGARKNLFQRIAAMRQGEALRACEVLGVPEKSVTFLGYPDGGLRPMWETNWSPQKPYFSSYTKTSQSPYENSFTPRAKYCGAAVLSDLEKIIREFHPTVIVTTHPEDTHPDHWSAYSYTEAALEALRCDEDASTRAMARRARLRTFIVHHGVWPAPHGYLPDAELVPPASLKNSGTHWAQEPLSIRTRAAKKAALECYVSQLVFTPHYLRSFIRKNELFGTVPPTTINSKSKPQNSKLLLSDAPCDSLWRERWPAADVRSIEAEGDGNGVLALRVDLGRAPSPRVRYRLVLHELSEGSTLAFGIEARPQNGRLQATLSALGSGSSTALRGRFTERGFQVGLPLSALQSTPLSNATLLVSANTHVGQARLDQTATATVHLFATP